MSTPHPRKSRRIWFASVCVAGVVLLVGVVIWFRRATAVVPEFYQVALRNTERTAELKKPADAFERSLLALRNDWEQRRTWRLVLRERELNAWLARLSPQRLSAELPKEWSEPRFALHEGCIFAAVHYAGNLNGVVSLQVEPYLLSGPREIALRVRSMQLGRVSIPESQWQAPLSLAATNAGVPLRWADEQGDPVAILTLPLQLSTESRREWEITSLAVESGELIVTGNSRPLPARAE